MPAVNVDPRILRAASLVLGATCTVVVATAPAVLGSNGTLLERATGCLLLLGAPAAPCTQAPGAATGLTFVCLHTRHSPDRRW